MHPIYNPATFNLRAVAAGTSLAALVFIGFDGVSILAEEVHNPKRNVLLAVLVVIFTGLFSGLQVYLAQRVWPDYTTLQNPETAFMDVARMASGPALFAAYGVMLLVSSIACGLAGHVGASRLLYSMGRDDVLPKKIFGYLSPKKSNPIYNVWIVGVLAYIGVITIPWEHARKSSRSARSCSPLMGVNLAAFRHFWFSASRRPSQLLPWTPSFRASASFSVAVCSSACKRGRRTWGSLAGRWDPLRRLQDARFHYPSKIDGLQRIVV